MNRTKVFQPEGLSELLRTYQKYPEALLWAGGTALAREDRGGGDFDLPGMIIDIAGVPELQRISRTERYFEIGAGVSISRILKVGQHVLPKVFTQSLRYISHPAIRNRGTLGGNLCHLPRRLNTFGPLTILDARLELRRLGKSRWIQVPRLFSKTGELTLQEGEIVSRVRIPFVEWNMQFFQKLGDPFQRPKSSLTFSALGDVKKGELTDVRVAISFIGKSFLRDRELETLITGRKVPLSDKTRGEARSIFRASLMDLPGEVTLFQKERSQRLMQWFLSALHVPPSELFY